LNQINSKGSQIVKSIKRCYNAWVQTVFIIDVTRPANPAAARGQTELDWYVGDDADDVDGCFNVD